MRAAKENCGKRKQAEAWSKAKKAVDDASTQADQAVIAESIRKGRMEPKSTFQKRSKDYNAVLAEQTDRHGRNRQHFNIAQAQTDYKYAIPRGLKTRST